MRSLSWMIPICMVFINCSYREGAAEQDAESSYSPPSMDRTYKSAQNTAASFMMADAPQYSLKTASKARASFGSQGGQSLEEVAQQDVAQSSPKSAQIHYESYVESEHLRPDSILNEAESLAVHLGGRTEQRSLNSATLLIPPALFDSAYFKIQSLATVLQKSKTAQNLSDQIADVALRIQIAEASLVRLNTLLAKAKSPEEKIQILQQIQRIRADLESWQNQSKTLAYLADFSKITYQVNQIQVSKPSLPQVEPLALQWLSQLPTLFTPNPITGKIRQQILDIEENDLKLGADFVFIKQPHHLFLSYASSSGTLIKSFKLRNNPQGDLSFWQKLLDAKIAKRYARTSWQKESAWQILNCIEHSRPAQKDSDIPRKWYMLSLDQEAIYLTLVDFPTKTDEERLGPQIRQAFGGIQP